MEKDDLAWFKKRRGTSRWLPCELRHAGGSFPAWIGYRGRYSRWFRKPSYELCFQRPGHFLGYDRLHLNASYRDPSLLRSRLSLDLFAQLGVPAPRAWHITLSMNEQSLGLYTAIESFDQRWLHQNGYGEGPIFYAVGTQGTLGYLDPETGRRKRYLAAGYEQADAYADRLSELESLIDAIVLPDTATFEWQIASILDVERFLRWFIGLEFLAHTDGTVQNYALFRPGGGRWLISPWDCDATLGRLPSGRKQQGDEMRLGTGMDNYLAVRLLASSRWRPVYVQLWERLLERELSLERVNQRLHEIFREIRPASLEDPLRRWSDSTFLRQPAEIRSWLVGRTERIRRMLEAGGEYK